ncbi:hypothetical protein [Methanoregula sp.]|uniref:hypothetical protein n=1 Tax=Methanoregula sp. TaxID=2052170 RepID=UPI003C77C89F
MKIWFLVALSCTIVVLLATAGCTQTFEPQPTPSPAPTTIPAELPTAVPIPVVTTPVPVPTAPALPLSLPTSIKDTQLLFTISAPDGYTGTTIRLVSSGYTSDYKTIIFNPTSEGDNQIIDDNTDNYSELTDSLTIFWLCRNPSLN